MATTTFFLNNTEETFVFNITGDAAEVFRVTAGGYILNEKDITTREAARAFYAQGLKFGLVKGNLMPLAVNIEAMIRDAVDPNWAEAELAELQG